MLFQFLGILFLVWFIAMIGYVLLGQWLKLFHL